VTSIKPKSYGEGKAKKKRRIETENGKDILVRVEGEGT